MRGNVDSYVKDERVALYEVLDDAACRVVLPVYLEQCRPKHYGQVVEIHQVHLGKSLHA